jgi:transposase
MVQLTLFPDNTPPPRWISPPWTAESEDWLKIDRDLPADDRARQIAELVAELDLSSLIRSYAGLGSSAHPPELLVRLVLYEIDRGRLSPAQWFRDCRRDDAVKWLLWGLRPSRSCLYQFRDRVGPHIDSWNRQVLQTARAEGWAPAQRAAVDGTFAAAYASRHALITAKTLETRTQQLDEAVAADYATRAEEPAEPASAPSPSPPPPTPTAAAPAPAATTAPAPAATTAPAPQAPARPTWMARTPRGRFHQQQRYHRAREPMARRQRRRRETMSRRAKAKRRPAAGIKISVSEPEAVLGLDKTKVFRPLYNIQFARDVDSEFILGWDVFAEATDTNLYIPLMKRTRDQSGTMPKITLNDGTYATIANLKFCKEQKITMYAPLADVVPAAPAGPLPESSGPAAHPAGAASASAEKPPRLIPKAAFTWLPEPQTYRCPQGHLLVLKRSSSESHEGEAVSYSQYRCPAEHCQSCPLANRCTRTPEQGRIIKRSEHDDLLEDLRQRMGQEPGQAVYKLRKQTVERQFADLKEHRGMRCFRSFGRERAWIQVGLLVLVHNGRQLLKARREAAEPDTPARRAG